MRKISSRTARKEADKDNDFQMISDLKIPHSLTEKLDMLMQFLEKSDDIISREFSVDGESNLAAAAVYLNGIIDNETFHQHILRPLILYAKSQKILNGGGDLSDIIYRNCITVGQVKKVDDLRSVIHNIYDGMLLLLFDGIQEALVIDIHGGKYRSIDEPPAEKAVRGPRDGFIENLDINISLVRRRLRDPRMVVKKTVVGQRSRTQVAIMYIEDIADPEIVEEVKTRLDKINTDAIPAAGFLEQYLEDNPYSLFPQIWTSERPDKVVMELMEGRVAVMADGTPTVIFAPSLFIEFFQASEDYIERTFIASYIRFMRFVAFVIAISLPAVYIALLSFQPELIPIRLLEPLAQARKEVPFPVVVETLVQEAIIQLVIEAGLRLPGTVGQTIGVVAGIILGQAAISAKIASPGIIIIVAITTICTFALPSGSMVQATRIIRIPMMLLAASFGLFGFSLGWLIILTHLSSLNSFGVAYFAPFAPMRWSDFKDSFFRIFLWKMDRRPVSIPAQQSRRQGDTRGNQGKKKE